MTTAYKVPKATALFFLGLLTYSLLSSIAMYLSLTGRGTPHEADDKDRYSGSSTPESSQIKVDQVEASSALGVNSFISSASDVRSFMSSNINCPLSNVSILVAKPFGTFREIPSKACSFKVGSRRYPSSVTRDVEGYRLPYYAADATRLYRCRTISQGSRHLIKRFLQREELEALEELIRSCILESNFDGLVSFAAEKASMSMDEAHQALVQWMGESTEGKLGLEAIRRVHTLESIRLQRQFKLIEEENEWRRYLASDIGQQVFPDVNTHKVELPSIDSQMMLAQNVRIEGNGRVISMNAEVFYPKRAPYSHRSLMEDLVEGNALHQFAPSESQRKAMGAKVQRDRPRALECLRLVESHDRAMPCAPAAKFPAGSSPAEEVAVNEVLVISQTLASQMFHYMCENLPRIGLYLDYLRENPSVHVHAGCLTKAGYCLPLLELLGINRSRVVQGPASVYARRALIPEGGRRHWPLANIWGLVAVREAVLTRHLPSHVGNHHRTYCDELREAPASSADVKANPQLIIRVAIVRRSLTRLTGVRGSWYDRLLTELQQDETFELNFNVKLDLKMFDDRDKETMSSALAQIMQMRSAEIVIGAHGAAWSWITFAQPCTHFLSFRGRMNSDIFEHLSLGMGVRFHHILFENSYEKLRRNIRRNMGIAIEERLRSSPRAKRPVVVMVCPRCSMEHAQNLADVFDFVVTEDFALPDHRIVRVQNLKNQCPTEYWRLIGDEVSTKLNDMAFHGRGVYWGYINDDEAGLVSPEYASLWVPLERFDAVLFAKAPSDTRAQIALFSSTIALPQEMCSGHDSLPSIGIALKASSVAIVLSPFAANTSSDNRRLFSAVSSTESHQQDKLLKLAEAVDLHSPYELFDSTDFPCGELGSYVMLKSKSSQWKYRCPPLGSLIRSRPSAETLGAPGPVVLIETPWAKSSDLTCTVNLRNALQSADDVRCP